MEIKGWLDKLFILGNQQDFLLGVGSENDDGSKQFWRNVKKENIGVKKDAKISYMLIAENFDKPYFKFFLQKVNQRGLLPCEVVLDIDEKEKIKPILEKLKLSSAKYYVYETGSKGYHVHIFFNRDLDEKEKKAIIKFFEADEQVVGDHLIALENVPHWKSGKIKREVQING